MTPEQRQALEQNEAPWSELDKGLKEAFFLAVAMYGEPWLWQSDLGGFVPSQQGQIPTQSNETVYRLARPEPKPLVVPWDALEDAVVCVAVDDGGNLQAAIDDIEDCVGGYWRFPRSHMVTPYVNLLKFERGNLPWQETKTWRPGHEPKEEG